MISQPRMNWTVLSATTMHSIPAANSVSAEKKNVKRRSPLTYSMEYSWISVAMSATTNIIITDRPSTCVPSVNLTPPDCHHVHWRMTGGTNVAASWPPSAAAGMIERPNDRTMPSAPVDCVPVKASTRWTHW